MPKLKENGEYPFKGSEITSGSQVLIYDYDVGICAMLDRLDNLITEPKVSVTIWSDSYFGDKEMWLYDAGEAYTLLEDKDINQIIAIEISTMGYDESFDWVVTDHFVFYPKEQIIKNFSYIIKDFH